MAVSDNFEQFNEFLKSQTGATEELLDELFSESHSFSPIFFKPIMGFASLKKFYTPISAPISFGILSLEFFLDTLIHLLRGIYDLLINQDMSGFSEGMNSALRALVFTGVMIASAVASPIINFVDLVGSIVTTGIALLCNKDGFMDDEANTYTFD